MEERKLKRTVRTKSNSVRKVVSQKSIKRKNKSKKLKLKPIIIIDYTFLISLVLSIIFGMQTNTAIFFLPFTITLVVTIVCMGIILVNAIYNKIKKKFAKKSK